MTRRWKLVVAAAAALLFAFPRVASAHLMNTGLGPFYDGLAHLFLTPEDLLPVLALTLLAGLRGPRHGRAVLFALPLAWLAGSAAGRLTAFRGAWPAAAVAAALTIVLGALTAADRPLPVPPVLVLAILLGLANGGSNGMELARARAGLLPALGVACALFVVVALVAAAVTSLKAPAARIAVRVGGSWIAASGLFLLGWSLRAG